MISIALWQPEIPPNTGNIARLCVATGCELHLVGRLGFRLDDRSLRRAGVDIWPHLKWRRHATQADFEKVQPAERSFYFTAHSDRLYTRAAYKPGDCLIFGSESGGLPEGLLRRHADRVIGIPMPGGKVRSLNLATAVGIALYEALRQLHNW